MQFYLLCWVVLLKFKNNSKWFLKWFWKWLWNKERKIEGKKTKTSPSLSILAPLPAAGPKPSHSFPLAWWPNRRRPSSPPFFPPQPALFLGPVSSRPAQAVSPFSSFHSHRQPGPACQPASSPSSRRELAGHGREQNQSRFPRGYCLMRPIDPLKKPCNPPYDLLSCLARLGSPNCPVSPCFRSRWACSFRRHRGTPYPLSCPQIQVLAEHRFWVMKSTSLPLCFLMLSFMFTFLPNFCRSSQSAAPRRAPSTSFPHPPFRPWWVRLSLLYLSVPSPSKTEPSRPFPPSPASSELLAMAPPRRISTLVAGRPVPSPRPNLSHPFEI